MDIFIDFSVAVIVEIVAILGLRLHIAFALQVSVFADIRPLPANAYLFFRIPAASPGTGKFFFIDEAIAIVIEQVAYFLLQRGNIALARR